MHKSRKPMKLCNLLCGLHSISQGCDLHFQYVPMCHMYACIRDGVWKDWADGTWWTFNTFSQLHPAALTKVPHCLVTLQAALWPPEEGEDSHHFLWLLGATGMVWSVLSTCKRDHCAIPYQPTEAVSASSLSEAQL